MKISTQIVKGFIFEKEHLSILDQTLLPHEERWIPIESAADCISAIEKLQIRGAPAIAMTAAYAAGIELQNPTSNFLKVLDQLEASRPTAVNLRNAMNRMRLEIPPLVASGLSFSKACFQVATKIEEQDRLMCDKLGDFGASLIPDNARVMTYCNTGAIATAGIGTAIGALYTADRTKKIQVYACETRPLLQGARITAWELAKAGIDVTLITDNMAASVMSSGIDLVIVGADRITQNGDTANKIGTLMLAILAKHFSIPFYVVAPTTTFDTTMENGLSIPIEERSADEVRSLRGMFASPKDAKVRNPAFDVTPASLISAIVSENGIYRAPYRFV